MNNSSNLYSFWDILKGSAGIEIPIIQRDYAHGRKNEQEIRANFLSSIKEAFSKPTIFDFVYGYQNENGFFIPLDGQQRLTTVFLLHWFLLYKSECPKKEDLGLLKKFTYKTRDNSKDFCNKLCFFNWKEDHSDDHKLSWEIKNQSWFFLHWLKDPTVSSILTMLDEIYKNFNEAQYTFEMLTSNERPVIRFIYLDLSKESDFKQGDLLYVRMNARGKPLTNFELFKADLKDLCQDFDILKDIDTTWTDYFWKQRYLINNEIDKVFLAVLKATITNSYFSTLSAQDVSGLKVDEFKIYERDEKFKKRINKETIEKTKKDLGCIVTQNFKLLPCFFPMDSKKKPRDIVLGYSDMLYWYGCCLSNNDDWIRIIGNLTKNMQWNTMGEYVNALHAIAEWSSNANDFLRFFAHKDFDSVTNAGFELKVLKEECIKAKKIIISEDWKKAILKAEEHNYFDSKVGFVLELLDKGEAEDNVDEFQKIWLIICELFDKNGLKEKYTEDELFRRALLSVEDYTFRTGKSDNYTVGRNNKSSGAYNSWNDLLFYYKDRSKMLQALKYVVYSINLNDVKSSLQAIIKNNKNTVTDWRTYLINRPQIWTKIGEDKFIRRSENDNLIYILERQMFSAKSYEYRSLALYYLILENYKGYDDIDYPELDGYKIKYLYIEKSNTKYYITFGKNNNPDPFEYLIYLEDPNNDDTTLSKKIANENEVIKFLDLTCKQ